MRTCRFELSPAYAHLEEFCKNIAQEFAQSNATIHRARNELKTLHVKGEALVVKSFKVPKGVQKWVYSFWKNSKAKTSYRNAHLLKDKGICTPEPVAYVEWYEGKILRESYFIAKEWKYDFTIREPLRNMDFPNRTPLLEGLANFAHSLHVKHILHLDFSPGNVLIRQKADSYVFCLVDINRMEIKPLDDSQKMKNFARLWARDSDLTCIINHYAKLANANPALFVPNALRASRRHKSNINLKKRLRGMNVAD